MRISKMSICVALVAILSACGGKETIYRKVSGATWGTTYNITYRSAENLDDSIVGVMRRVDESLSVFNDGSLVSRVNRGERVEVDSLFATVFDMSKRVNRCSNGAFDPTVSPLVDIWGFGRDKGVVETPTQAAIDSLLCRVGIADCRIEGGYVVKKHIETQFNFSAIAKGYGCDLIAEMFKRNDCEDYLIEIGGEVVLSGKNHQGKPWRIMIDTPIASDSAVIHESYYIVEPGDCGMATSGNYRNYRELGGKRVGHTINPKTGFPVETTTASVTIIAPTAGEADAYATACMAMPLADAMKMIERQPSVEGLFIVSTAQNGFFYVTTSGFPADKQKER